MLQETGVRSADEDPRRQFRDMEATLLLCPGCKVAVPVRKRLLLVLPEGDKFEYVCARCASSCGTKIERPPPPHFGR